MPTIKVNGVELHYVSEGTGVPIILVHELAMDASGWRHQTAALCRTNRVIALNLRGYPPSTVPTNALDYDHDQLVDDLDMFKQSLGLHEAFVIGHGTGGNIALSHALNKPSSVLGLVIVGAGAGNFNPGWKARSTAFSQSIADQGIKALRDSLENAPQRRPLLRKNPSEWQAFLDSVDKLSASGISNLLANGVRNRPMFSDLEEKIRTCSLPMLVVAGDCDTPAFEPSLYLSRTAPYAGLAILPNTGHTLPLEEPDMLNAQILNFIKQVSSHTWAQRSACA